MKEKIKFEVFVDIEYFTKSDRKKYIDAAKDMLISWSTGGIGSARPTSARISRKQVKKEYVSVNSEATL